MTERTFALPDLGEGLADAEVLRWLVEVGDEVTVDQPLVEVETAKAAVELPSPYAGVITARHGEPGERIGVGSPVVTVDDGADDSRVLVGFGTSEARRSRRLRPQAPVASPVVRKLARDNGIEVSALHGSGAGGLITRADVEAAIAIPTPSPGVHRAMAEQVTRSRREIPDATVWMDLDATALLAAKSALSTEDSPMSIVALLARICVLGLRKFPELNARIEAGGIVPSSTVELGFAAQTERGLMVPVVHGAEELTTRQLAERIAELTHRARTATVSVDDLRGGSFTVNNYGVLGVDGSAAIINYPEVAILGLGRIMDRPWVVDGELVIRKVTELTLSFDHRACDGGTASGFLRFVADRIAHPLMILADV